MRIWHDEDGEAFTNSDVCFGREYNADDKKLNVAKILVRGVFPENGWGYNEEASEMAVITRGAGWVQQKGGERRELAVGDVVYFAAGERVRWGGDFDMIVPCAPAFEPSKHHIEEEV